MYYTPRRHTTPRWYAFLVTASTEQQIVDFIVKNFLFGKREQAPAPEQSFLQAGVIDSTGVLELVAFVEETYGIAVADDELVPAHFDSVRNLATFVERKRGQA